MEAFVVKRAGVIGFLIASACLPAAVARDLAGEVVERPGGQHGAAV